LRPFIFCETPVTSRQRLTQTRLREILHYDPDTGEFRWRQRVSYSIQVGGIAGGLNKTTGYWQIGICGRSYMAHQLAWLYMTGAWCHPMVDHRDLDRANNRWNNLRCANRSTNGANRPRHRNNASGFKGVHQDRRSGRWIARLHKDGQRHHLGRYATAEAAHAAYVAAAKRLFGEFARAE
jgi:hypothetical protein